MIFRQPATDEEIQLCIEALEEYPAESSACEPTQALAAPVSEKVMQETIVELLRAK